MECRSEEISVSSDQSTIVEVPQNSMEVHSSEEAVSKKREHEYSASTTKNKTCKSQKLLHIPLQVNYPPRKKRVSLLNLI